MPAFGRHPVNEEKPDSRLRVNDEVGLILTAWGAPPISVTLHSNFD